MQSGIDTSRARIAAEAEYFAARAPVAVAVAEAQRPPTSTTSSDFFGADGLSFRDVLDAVNPLNHIPILSELLAEVTDHKPSPASRIVGGGLLGGPLGLVASLAGLIFEGETGHSPIGAIYAALDTKGAPPIPDALAIAAQEGPPAPTLNAANEAPIALASLSQPRLPEPSSEVALSAQQREATAATASPTTGQVGAVDPRAILDLYGASSSAHASYRNAQMRPYLRDVTVSKVL